LRRNNSAQRMTPRQHNAAMIDFGRRPGCMIEGRLTGALYQGSAAGGAPISFSLSAKHCMAMAANAFHH
jgi:hypothetical protein